MRTKSFKRIIHFLRPFKKKAIFIAFFILFLEGTKIIGWYVFKLILDAIVNFNIEDLNYIISLSVIMLVANGFISFFVYLSDRQIGDLILSIEYYASNTVTEKLLNLSLGYHEKEDTGNKITKVQRGVEKLIRILYNIYWSSFKMFSQILIVIVALFVVSPYMGLLYVIMGIFFMFFTLQLNKKIQKARVKINKYYENASGQLGQAIINIYTVQSFVQEYKELQRYKKTRKSLFKTHKKMFYTIFAYNLLRAVIIDIAQVFLLLLGIYLVYINNITIGTLVFVSGISSGAYHSLFSLAFNIDHIAEAATTADRTLIIMEDSSEIKDKEKTIKPKEFKGEVEFKNVSFSYEDRKQGVLRNISFKINPGERIGIVGPSGGGKSTIVKLLFRHYDVKKGSVLVDGIDLREYDHKAYRRYLSIVPQEVEIFNGTIYDNIVYGKKNASKQEVLNASKTANAYEFIKTFPKKFNTIVGERGVKLSGGQRQRVGIARAVITKPSILVFDEATSNLDSYSEKLIQKAINNIKGDQTMVVIAHRLSTIRRCDKIIVIEDGKVVEQGTHEHLKKNKGVYAHLVELQNEGKM